MYPLDLPFRPDYVKKWVSTTKWVDVRAKRYYRIWRSVLNSFSTVFKRKQRYILEITINTRYFNHRPQQIHTYSEYPTTMNVPSILVSYEVIPSLHRPLNKHHFPASRLILVPHGQSVPSFGVPIARWTTTTMIVRKMNNTNDNSCYWPCFSFRCRYYWQWTIVASYIYCRDIYMYIDLYTSFVKCQMEVKSAWQRKFEKWEWFSVSARFGSVAKNAVCSWRLESDRPSYRYSTRTFVLGYPPEGDGSR